MGAEIELRHLRSVVALADELHFGRAATVVGITQPALSQQIQGVEASLGVTLFARSSRSVEVTEAGAALVSRARELLAQVARDVREVQRVARGESGHLVVAFVPSAIALIAAAYRVYAAGHPDVEVELRERTTDSAVDDVERGTADIALVRDSAATGVRIDAVQTEEFLAVVPCGHPAAGAEAVTVDVLAQDPLIFFPDAAGRTAYERNLQPFRDAGYDPAVAHEAAQWPTILHLVAAGIGVTIAPASAAHVVPIGAVAVALRDTPRRSQLELITRLEETRALVAHFRDAVFTARSAPGAHDIGRRPGATSTT